MQKSTRTTIFFLLFALFVITAPAIIAYSQGYRIDFENKELVKTGGLFLEPRPAPVELFINGQFEKKSNFVFQNIFIGNLLPRTYLVEIKKEDYFTWRKALAIEEKLVTEIKNLMLFPNFSKEELIGRDVSTFSAHNNYLSLIGTEAPPNITIYDKEGKKDTLTLNNLISRRLEKLRWNKDATRAIFNTGSSWILISIDAPERSTDISKKISSSEVFSEYTMSLYGAYTDDIKWGEDNSTLFFLARDARILKHKANILFSYNINDGKLSSPLAYNVLNYQPGGGRIIYVSSILGDVHSINLETGISRPLSFQNIASNEKDSAEFIISGEKVIAAIARASGSAKDIYVYDRQSSLFEKISDEEDVIDVKPSLDGKKLMLLGKNKISVYWLEEVHIQPFRERGDLLEIYTSHNALLSAGWFSKDNEHIFFSAKDGVWITELDGRDKRNTHKLSDMPAREMHYDAASNTLYILSNNALYAISLSP